MKLSETVFKAYFKNECKYISREVFAELDKYLEEKECRPEVMCRFIMDTRKPEYIYPRWLLSNAIKDEFSGWLAEKAKIVPVLAGLELEAFYAEARLIDDPRTLVLKEGLEISPLLRYLMGCFLGVPDAVEKYKLRASQQLLELPWYRKVFFKLSEFYPEEVPYAE